MQNMETRRGHSARYLVQILGRVGAVLQRINSLCFVFIRTLQEFSLAALAGDKCHCGFPTTHFTLHDPEEENLCLNRCAGEDIESCGNEEYFVVYQTQVQGKSAQGQLECFHGV